MSMDGFRGYFNVPRNRDQEIIYPVKDTSFFNKPYLAVRSSQMTLILD